MEKRPGRVLAFDSGIGGLGVVQALRATLPPETHIDYLADNALFPYGEQPDDTLIRRIVVLIGEHIDRTRPDVVLIACNTATTLALATLRERYALPFVGCVPPVRWAARVSTTRVIGLFATAATARRPYLRALHHDYAADCTMIVHGARGLADLAERAFLGKVIDDAQVAAELKCLFGQPSGERIDTVGLGCTHYTFLLDTFMRLSPPGVAWLDPAHAVAQQVARVLNQQTCISIVPTTENQITLTAAPPDSSALVAAVRRMGFGTLQVLENQPAQCARLTV